MPATLRDRIRLHAEAAYPAEACGALFGLAAGTDRPIVTRAVPLSNSAPQPRDGFRIEADELQRACLTASTTRESLIGIYHSHPDRGTVPSPDDVKQAIPGTWYLTVSVRGGRAGAWAAWVCSAADDREAACPS